MICLFFCNESIGNERRQSSAASAGFLSCKIAVKKIRRKHYAEVTTPRVNTTATVPHSRTAKGIKSNVYHNNERSDIPCHSHKNGSTARSRRKK